MIYTKEEIKNLLEQKLTHLSGEMRDYLNTVREKDGVDGLLRLKEWLDNTDMNSDALPVKAKNILGIGDGKEFDKMVGDVISADRPDITRISEGDNLFASKVDVDAFDTNNKPSTIYRGEYFYLTNKDEYNSYLSAAVKKRANKKHDFVIDNDTFMKNFVTINKESIEPFMDEDVDIDNQMMCPNCGGVSYHFGLTEDFTCPYCTESRLDNMVANASNKETLKQKEIEEDQKNKIRKSFIVPSGTSDVKGLVNPPVDSSVTLGGDGGAPGGPGF